jgi:hypothetical protein
VLRRLLLLVALIPGMLSVGCGMAQPACDVVVAALPPNAPPPDAGDVLPAGAAILAAPGDIDWSASSIGPDQPGGRPLNLQLRPEAAERLASYSRDNVGSFLPIALNGRVVVAPMLQSEVEGGLLVIQFASLDPAETVTAFEACFR